MYFCDSQSFILEHFLRIDTSQPKIFLSALQVLANSPCLSRKIISSPDKGDFRARLSFLRSNDLNVLGSYLRNPSMISGTNAGFATIIMPVEGRVDFDVAGEQCLCGPWMPFHLEPGEDFHATLSEETDLLIIQLPCLTESGYRPLFRRHQASLVELLIDFLCETPFFRDYNDAKCSLECLSTRLYGLVKANDTPRPAPGKQKQVREDRRLCSAVQLMNAELGMDIDIQSIASRSGLSLRSLHYLMKQYIGQPPYQYLRGRRLIKARESIVRDYPENTSIAQHGLNWGFQHAGRFSSYYQKHFGEYPSQTLSELNYLKQLSDKVRSVRDDSGDTRPHWLTSSATTAVNLVETNSGLDQNVF